MSKDMKLIMESFNNFLTERNYKDEEMFADLYLDLGLAPTNDAKAIKNAFRKLAIANHPDRGGDAEKMKNISYAYGILKDPQTKKEYDQWAYQKSSQECKVSMDKPFCGHNGARMKKDNAHELRAKLVGASGGQQGGQGQDQAAGGLLPRNQFFLIQNAAMQWAQGESLKAMESKNMKLAMQWMEFIRGISALKFDDEKAHKRLKGMLEVNDEIKARYAKYSN
jgi:DnaJ-class molecular chaperone